MHFLICKSDSPRDRCRESEITTFQNLLSCSSPRFSPPKLIFLRPRWDSNPQSPAPEADALSIRPLGHHGIRVLTPSPYAMPSSRTALALCGLPSGGLWFGSRPQCLQHAPAHSCALHPSRRQSLRAHAQGLPHRLSLVLRGPHAGGSGCFWGSCFLLGFRKGLSPGSILGALGVGRRNSKQNFSAWSLPVLILFTRAVLGLCILQSSCDLPLGWGPTASPQPSRP